MGRRSGRKQTLRVKKERVQGGARPAPRVPVDNGFIWCNARDERINTSICTVRQTRDPQGCIGCREYRG
jgi:hypothetical protein